MSKIKETKKTCFLSTNFDKYEDPDKVIFNFLSYNLYDHEKWILCESLSITIPYHWVFKIFTTVWNIVYRNNQQFQRRMC